MFSVYGRGVYLQGQRVAVLLDQAQGVWPSLQAYVREALESVMPPEAITALTNELSQLQNDKNALENESVSQRDLQLQIASHFKELKELREAREKDAREMAILRDALARARMRLESDE